MSENLALLKLVLPELLFEYFDLTKQETSKDSIHLYFEEYNDSTFIQEDVKVHSNILRILLKSPCFDCAPERFA